MDRLQLASWFFIMSLAYAAGLYSGRSCFTRRPDYMDMPVYIVGVFMLIVGVVSLVTMVALGLHLIRA